MVGPVHLFLTDRFSNPLGEIVPSPFSIETGARLLADTVSLRVNLRALDYQDPEKRLATFSPLETSGDGLSFGLSCASVAIHAYKPPVRLCETDTISMLLT